MADPEPGSNSHGSVKFPMQRLILALFLSLVLALSFLLSLPPQSAEDPDFIWGIPLCGFKLLTGIPCPFCGLTRSFVFTAHGQWEQAFLHNFLGPLLWMVTLAAAIYHWGGVLRALLRRRGPETKVRRPGGAGRKKWVGRVVFVAFLAAWALKLLLIDRQYW